MSFITGSFSGTITKQTALPLSDQANHQLGIAEVDGIQKSPDALWNDSNITYWGVIDLINGNGTQRGYFNNIHPDGGRDFGTFEGQVTGGGLVVEGTFTFTGGDGKYHGITGGGKFKTVAKSETEVEASWEGNYELASAQSG